MEAGWKLGVGGWKARIEKITVQVQVKPGRNCLFAG